METRRVGLYLFVWGNVLSWEGAVIGVACCLALKIRVQLSRQKFKDNKKICLNRENIVKLCKDIIQELCKKRKYISILTSPFFV